MSKRNSGSVMLLVMLLGLSIVMLTPLASVAAEGGDVKAALTAYKVDVDSRGKEIFTAAHEVRPGEVLEYRVDYINHGEQIARQVRAVLPIPGELFNYVPDSTRPAKVWASLDGRSYALVPLLRTVTLADGRREVQPVPVSEYRFLRWDLGDMKPGAKAAVSARMRMTGVAPVAGGAQ